MDHVMFGLFTLSIWQWRLSRVCGCRHVIRYRLLPHSLPESTAGLQLHEGKNWRVALKHLVSLQAHSALAFLLWAPVPCESLFPVVWQHLLMHSILVGHLWAKPSFPFPLFSRVITRMLVHFWVQLFYSSYWIIVAVEVESLYVWLLY